MSATTSELLFPNLGLEVEQGEIVAWLVAPGDAVRAGQALLTVATDKADSDVHAEGDGYVVEILEPEGATVSVGTPIALLSDAPADATAPPAPAPAAQAPAAALAPLPRLRRLTAERMAQSQQVPQFDVFREVDVAAAAALVERVRAAAPSGPRAGLNDVLLVAYARTLAEHRRLNASYVDDEGAEPSLREPDGVHVALAVATERGLVAPVVRSSERRSLSEVAGERERLVAAARDGALSGGDLASATTTLSSLARFGIDGFGGMVTPPQAAILAVGPARPRALVRDGALTVGQALTLTLTVDHRVVDGAEAAAALAALGDLLESDAELAALETPGR